MHQMIEFAFENLTKRVQVVYYNDHFTERLWSGSESEFRYIDFKMKDKHLYCAMCMIGHILKLDWKLTERKGRHRIHETLCYLVICR